MKTQCNTITNTRSEAVDEIVTTLGSVLRDTRGIAEAAESGVFLAVVRILADGRPAAIAEIAAAVDRSVEDVARIVSQIPNVERDREGRVIGLGLTFLPTPHRVFLPEGDAWFLTYRRPRAICTDGEPGPSQRRGRRSKIALWSFTALAILAALLQIKSGRISWPAADAAAACALKQCTAACTDADGCAQTPPRTIAATSGNTRRLGTRGQSVRGMRRCLRYANRRHLQRRDHSARRRNRSTNVLPGEWCRFPCDRIKPQPGFARHQTLFLLRGMRRVFCAEFGTGARSAWDDSFRSERAERLTRTHPRGPDARLHRTAVGCLL